MSEPGRADRTAARRRLARHPIAVDCARSAHEFGADVAEVVVFEDDHVFVAASSTATGTFLPRAMNAAEIALEADSSSAGTWFDGWTSLPIRSMSGSVVGALSVFTPEPPASLDGYRSLARIVETQFHSTATHGDDFFHDLLEGLRDVVVIVNPALEVTWVSQGVGSMLGRTPAEFIGRSAAEFLHPDDIEITIDALTRVSQGLELYRVYVRLLADNDEYVRVEVTGNDLTDTESIGGIVMSLRDAQQDRELGLEMERTRRISDAIVGGLRDGVLATDEFGALVRVNDTARAMFDIDPSKSTAQLSLDQFRLVTLDGHPHDLFGPSDNDDVCCLVSERGEVRYVTTAHQPILDSDGRPAGQVVVFSDITIEHCAAEELRTQALHDHLTGLANRRQLDQRLNDLATSASHVNVAACLIDLDAFKSVNDTHGHRVGDQLVRIAARRLDKELRGSDLLVRQGGDEFVALLVGVADLDEASQVAQRCREVLCKPYVIGAESFHVTASIGVAIAAADRLNPDVLLQHADLALYAAKDRGRNRVEVFDAALAETASNEESQRRMLREALATDRLLMHFQPMVDATTEQTVGYEALARIRSADGEILGPAAFIDAVATTSLMWELDRAAFELSCSAAAMLARIDPDNAPYVSCNFAPISVNHPDFIDFLSATVAAKGVDPGQIVIELTETAAFEAGDKGAASLIEVTARGFKLALDDFGTGYSSLSHIRDLPITSIKVDRSFVSQMGVNVNERSIAEAVVKLADDLEIGVVAEGVETVEQLGHAQDIGFSTIQGWYYSKAISLTECLQDWSDATKPALVS